MALQNRVDPFGDIVAVPYRGTMMGNRGRLHDRDRRIVRARHLNRWLCCALTFRGRHRTVMSPRGYTELFFLDEATALAAGHRPCSECRHSAYQRFRRAWLDAGLSAELPRAAAIDARLASDRGADHTPIVPLGELPDGVLVQHEGDPHLLWDRQLHRWDWTGYHAPDSSRAQLGSVRVLTPKATVDTIHAGYPVTVHPTALV
jgi:hypothetical protein